MPLHENFSIDNPGLCNFFPDDPLYSMSLDSLGGSFLDASQQNLGQISAEFSSPIFSSIPQDHGLYQTAGQIYQAGNPLIAGLAEPSTVEGCELNTNEAGVALRYVAKPSSISCGTDIGQLLEVHFL